MTINQIDNLEVYLKRMDATIIDKCWWVSEIPSYITTVVDFGCAAGHLKEVLAVIAPNLRYIGIENNSKMFTECRDKDIEVYWSLEELKRWSDINFENTILVLNSVIHEILTYEDNGWATLREMEKYGFEYIAIRDMHAPDLNYELINSPTINLYNHILKSPYHNQFEEFFNETSKREQIYKHPIIVLTEFLLKYRYIENWDRECKEQYLWYWEDVIFQTYKVMECTKFSIPWIRDRIEKDFHIKLNLDTHRKILLQKGE